MRKGFTLVETMIATSLMTATVIVAVGSLILFIQKSSKVNNQAMLDMDARKVVERFRQEVRNAARETILFYPENTKPYTGLSFALAGDTDNDGLMDMDPSGTNILWSKTVVYHVYRDSEIPQMRRTVFKNRNNDVGEDDYYTQLEEVVLSGSGESACISGESASTSVIFQNLFSGKLWDTQATFDCYDSEPNKLERVTFGSISLGPGPHTMEMIITGKHPQSSGRSLRLDQLSSGVCGWPLEAELRSTGGASATTLFTEPNQTGAAYALYAATAADGDKLTIQLYNDAIEEAEFIGLGRNVSLSNTVVRFDEEFCPSGHAQGSYATLLDGQFAKSWDVASQTKGWRNTYNDATNCVIRIPVMRKEILKDGYRPVFRFYKPERNNGTSIISAKLLIEGKFEELEFYQNGEETTWDNCLPTTHIDMRPKHTTKIDILEGASETDVTMYLILYVRINSYTTDKWLGYRSYLPARPGALTFISKESVPNFANLYTNLLMSESVLFEKDGGSVLPTDPKIERDGWEIDKLWYIPFLEKMTVNYADEGEYISHVYDTRSFNGATKKIQWEAVVPDDEPVSSTLSIFTRSGNRISDNGFEIIDAPAWENVERSLNNDEDNIISMSGRYVQFRAVATSQHWSTPPWISGGIPKGPYRIDTPRLYHVLITWAGEEKYVDVVGNLLKNPDCGMFKVEIDGKPMIRGVNMEIEIFKDIRTMGGAKERITSKIMAEVEPRNNKQD